MQLDVYRDPWIDAQYTDGHIDRLSLRECIAQSRDIQFLFIQDAKYALDNTVPYTLLLLINIIRKLAIKSEVHLKIIAITVTLVLKSCFLMYMLLMKKLSITITVFLLRWKNSLMEKLLLFYMKTKFL